MASFQINPVFETKLVRKGSIKTQPMVRSSDRAKEVCIEYLKDSPCERFVIVMLSTQNQLIGMSEITVGTLDASLVHPREVFRPAILANASAIIVAHNHPSGVLVPSSQDHAVYSRLKQAGELLGIRVLDSIVCNDEEAISMET